MRLRMAQKKATGFAGRPTSPKGRHDRLLPSLPGRLKFGVLFLACELLRERFHESVMPEPSSPCKQIRSSAGNLREGQGFAEPSADFRESGAPQAANWQAFFRTSF